MDYLKNLGFVNAKTEIKGDDKIEVTLPMQDNITQMAEMLNFSDKALKFTDYKNNILLTGNDISAVSAGQDESDSYYIKLNFTKQGQDKFKQATYEVSQISIPNNYIQITIDDNVIFAPHITQEINTDSCTINGDFTQAEAE
ncbi:MAG: SecDF P1 head subdomain-containing protein [Clostridia bacterium]